jgi:hypothetical protein
MQRNTSTKSQKQRPVFYNLTGQRFGRLLVIKEAPRRSKHNVRSWFVLCDCGTHKEIRQSDLLNSGTSSCGCLGTEVRRRMKTTHGFSRRQEYWSYTSIKERCYRKTHASYESYGGRGIAMCARWRESIIHFINDMGPMPSKKHTVDRIDNSKGYWCGKPECPECGPLGRTSNCRWATAFEQSRNTRRNRILIYNGKSQTMRDWANEKDMGFKTLSYRIDAGWSVEDALTIPVDRSKYYPRKS